MAQVIPFACSPDESAGVEGDIRELEQLVERFWQFEDRSPTVDEAVALLGVSRPLAESVLVASGRSAWHDPAA